MKTWIRRVCAGVVVAALVTLALPALQLSAQEAPSAGGYALDWWTADSGGQTGTSHGGYTLEGTIGQPDAAFWEGGDYTLAGGFWVEDETVAPPAYDVYLPVVMKQQ